LSAAVNQQQYQNLQLNHKTQSQSRIARLKPVYRHPTPRTKTTNIRIDFLILKTLLFTTHHKND
ncbi:hypothetical protein ACRW3C_29835, partial [Escherichia coli]